MVRRAEDVATVVVAISRAAGNSLDASTIFDRTMAVLEPAIDLGSSSLWRTDGDRLEAVATRPTGSGEVRLPDLEGTVAVPGELTLSLESRGHPIGVLVVRSRSGGPFSPSDEALVDIAASQIAGALERSQLFAEVMELDRLKTDFIARVSHELRTPITIINGFLETLIAHDGRLPADQRLHMLERSRAAAARLADLIEELLILSRIEGGVLTPQPEALVAADVLEAVRESAAEPEQVLLDGELSLPLVVDRTLLTRALGLLVDNAVKYGGAAELTASTDGDRFVVEVRDRGPGFPSDVRHIAFEMFTRSQSSSSIPGLGVGLAIARTLVEVLDGTIEIVDAHPGPGALVRVSLPG